MEKKEEDIRKLVTETKKKDYGDPVESMTYCAKFWTLALDRAGVLKEGKEISPRLACSMMVMFKQSRDIGNPRDENIRDTQGYAEIQKIEAETETKLDKPNNIKEGAIVYCNPKKEGIPVQNKKSNNLFAQCKKKLGRGSIINIGISRDW